MAISPLATATPGTPTKPSATEAHSTGESSWQPLPSSSPAVVSSSHGADPSPMGVASRSTHPVAASRYAARNEIQAKQLCRATLQGRAVMHLSSPGSTYDVRQGPTAGFQYGSFTGTGALARPVPGDPDGALRSDRSRSQVRRSSNSGRGDRFSVGADPEGRCRGRRESQPTHATLKKTRNHAYAVEGLNSAYLIARMRIDVTQHQMHAVTMALEEIYVE